MRTAKPKAAQPPTAARSAPPARRHAGHSRAGKAGLHLQQTAGNQAVQRLLKPTPDTYDAAHLPRTEQAQAMHEAAQRGLQGTARPLPFLDTIQQAFGRHDVTQVDAHVGGPARQANEQMGAAAYTTGPRVAFKHAPDLRTAAHEAAHVVQQRAGVSLPGGIGQAGDRYEQQADAVADAVVQGRSAEPSLDRSAGTVASSSHPVQHQPDLRSERYEAAQQGQPQPSGGQPAGAGVPHLGSCTLRSGIMRWSLVPRLGYVNARIEFVPNTTVAAASRTISFIQTVSSTETTGGFLGIGRTTGATRPEVDVLSGESDPFYGAQWNRSTGQWRDEPGSTQVRPGDYTGQGGAREGSRPYTASTGSAVINDSPMLLINQTKQFETVAMVVETGEVLGTLSWNIQRWSAPSFFGLGPDSSTIVRRATCSEGAPSGFQQVVEQFYTGQLVVLDGFAAGSADLSAAHRSELDRIVARLQGSAQLKARVGGAATQDEPDPAVLSRRRAEQVRDYLVRAGIAQERIEIEAYGSAWARTPVTSPGATQANRRVQIKVYQPR